MRRVLLCTTAFIALAVAPAATANRPIREVIEAPPDMVITGQCAFPVLGHIEGREIDTTFVDRAGDPKKLIGVFPGNTLTLTNLDSGTSITLQATGRSSCAPSGTAPRRPRCSPTGPGQPETP